VSCVGGVWASAVIEDVRRVTGGRVTLRAGTASDGTTERHLGEGDLIDNGGLRK